MTPITNNPPRCLSNGKKQKLISGRDIQFEGRRPGALQCSSTVVTSSQKPHGTQDFFQHASRSMLNAGGSSAYSERPSIRHLRLNRTPGTDVQHRRGEIRCTISPHPPDSGLTSIRFDSIREFHQQTSSECPNDRTQILLLQLHTGP